MREEGPIEKVNILMVDDHIENLIALRAILTDPAYELVLATTPEEALIQLLRRDFAVILLDVMMPEMDGFELAAMIKGRQQSRYIPIIFLTAIAKDPDYIARGYAVGAVDYLPKPFQPEVVKSKVAVFVELYRMNQQMKRQGELLRESERRDQELKSLKRYRALANAIPHMVWTAQPDGKLVYFNQLWLTYTGRTLEESQGQGWIDAIHPEDRDSLLMNWKQAITSGEGFETECRILQKKDQTYRWYLIRGVPEKEYQGNVTGWIGTNTDIHERKKAEETREKAIRMRDEFLAVASHELKTPLTPLKLQVQKIWRSLESEKGDLSGSSENLKRTVEGFSHQVNRLSELIENMLDISLINNGQFYFQFEDTDLIRIVVAVTERFKRALKNAQCEVQLVKDVPSIHGNWDSNRIEQVISNLLTNAMKFGAGRPIQIRLGTENNNAVVRLHDDGIGISKEDLNRIFAQFERATPAENFGGLGLGLFIVKKIIDGHGGKIEVESEPGKGATFIIGLPMQQSSQNTNTLEKKPA